ncbi:MAG: GNAT family N-acetyltransferase [Armatimonadota bacterium]|jgi:ribosomal protein S18 acetylase RimI-like enzyme
MKIEQLQLDNLRDGVFCPQGGCITREGNGNLDAWLDGGILRGQIARDDNGDVLGFVLYYPIEMAPMEDGEGFYMVQCLHVDPTANRARIAKMLIDNAVADAFAQGGTSMTTQSLAENEYPTTPATFVHNRGINTPDSHNFTTVYYVVFNEAQPHTNQRAQPGRSKLRIDIVDCEKCYSDAYKQKPIVKTIEKLDTKAIAAKPKADQETTVDRYFSSGIFLDGKLIYFVGPTSEDDVMNAIEVAESARKRSMDR